MFVCLCYAAMSLLPDRERSKTRVVNQQNYLLTQPSRQNQTDMFLPFFPHGDDKHIASLMGVPITRRRGLQQRDVSGHVQAPPYGHLPMADMLNYVGETRWFFIFCRRNKSIIMRVKQ